MVFVLNIFYVWKIFKLDMLQRKSIFVLFLWRYSAKSVTFFFHDMQQIFLMKYVFQLTFMRLFISNFLFCHFAPVTQEKDALQRMMTLSHYHGNTPLIETHLAVVRGLPTKNFLPECVKEKSSTERRS